MAEHFNSEILHIKNKLLITMKLTNNELTKLT